jgi:Flp pilus assembly protein TadD
MDDSRGKRQNGLICLGLTLAVLIAYSPLWRAQFTLFDDIDYVTANDMVKKGLSGQGLVWAFSTFHAANWHPLTWLSHMLDVQLYGMNPAGHHLTSVLLHLVNSVLLFFLLLRMTKARWASALVAAFFALHPLHVESVAWISERKDVLSALFWMLSVGAYVRYAGELATKGARARDFYAASVLWFVLGLMAKPMLVTLPCVLILIDYWPLQRLRPPLARLMAEKFPFFILAAASSVITFFAQRQGNAVMPLGGLSLRMRLENAPISYLRYLEKTFWPANLALFYPFPEQWPIWEVSFALALLAGITAWALWRIRSQPYLAVGWLWFLGMLAPVIGLVQVGGQSMADRYDYLPGIGIFIMVVWAGREWLACLGPRTLAILSGLALVACTIVTRIQAQYWTNDETLFRHALAVTGPNGAMENDLGKILLQKGRVDEALPHLYQAVEFAPGYPLPHYNLGSALLAKGKVPEALAQFDIQVHLDPNDSMGQDNFGGVLLKEGLVQDAIPHLEKAVQLRPDSALYHYTLGNALRQAGHAAEAVSQYEDSLRLFPNYLNAASALAWMLATTPDRSLRNGPEAVQFALLAVQLSPEGDPKAGGILAAAYAEAGNFPAAKAAARRALQLAGAAGDAALVDTLRAQLVSYEKGEPFREK